MRRSPQHVSLAPVPHAHEHAIASPWSVETSAASGSRERTHSVGNTFYRDTHASAFDTGLTHTPSEGDNLHTHKGPKPVRGLRFGEGEEGGGGERERSGGWTTRDVLSHPSTLRTGVCAFVCLCVL